MGDKMAEAMSRSITQGNLEVKNRPMQVVNLEGNHLGRRGADMILESLCTCKALLHLNLSHNHITKGLAIAPLEVCGAGHPGANGLYRVRKVGSEEDYEANGFPMWVHEHGFYAIWYESLHVEHAEALDSQATKAVAALKDVIQEQMSMIEDEENDEEIDEENFYLLIKRLQA